MKTARTIFLALCLALAGLPGALSAQGMADTLRMDVEFLCDSLCMGRASGTSGYSEAGAYVLRRFRDNGFTAAPDVVRPQYFSLGEGKVGRNFMAFLPSTTGKKTDRLVVVMAYLDGRGEMGGVMYPGADADASGVAAMLGIARRLSAAPVRTRNVLFVALDGHHSNSAGACALWDALSSGSLTNPVTGTTLSARQLSLVVSLDIVGSTLSPVVKYRKDYLIALGGSSYAASLTRANAPLDLHLTYDYYGSRDFTNLFYRKVGDHKLFLDRGVPCVMFTSGITMMTNKPSDTPQTLDYAVLEKRVALISSWLRSLFEK